MPRATLLLGVSEDSFVSFGNCSEQVYGDYSANSTYHLVRLASFGAVLSDKILV